MAADHLRLLMLVIKMRRPSPSTPLPASLLQVLIVCCNFKLGICYTQSWQDKSRNSMSAASQTHTGLSILRIGLIGLQMSFIPFSALSLFVVVLHASIHPLRPTLVISNLNKAVPCAKVLSQRRAACTMTRNVAAFSTPYHDLYLESNE